MGVQVREKPKGSGVYYVFINYQGRRKSKKIGTNKKTADEIAEKIKAKLHYGEYKMKKYKWFSSKFPGVRYRKHPKRKHGVKFDRYFTIKYQCEGKRREEAVGWASEGWTAEKAALIRAEFKNAYKTGSGEPTSLSEKRERIKNLKLEKRKIHFSTIKWPSDPTGSFVYFVQQGENGAIKIGITKSNIANRIEALQTASSSLLRLVGYIRDAHPLSLEKELHSKFKKHRLRGEWFRPHIEIWREFQTFLQ